MTDMAWDALRAGDSRYNQGERIDWGSIDREAIGKCPNTNSGEHQLRHDGLVPEPDGRPIVSCRCCSVIVVAEWKG